MTGLVSQISCHKHYVMMRNHLGLISVCFFWFALANDAMGAMKSPFKLALTDPIHPERSAKEYEVRLNQDAQGFPVEYHMFTGCCVLG